MIDEITLKQLEERTIKRDKKIMDVLMERIDVEKNMYDTLSDQLIKNIDYMVDIENETKRSLIAIKKIMSIVCELSSIDEEKIWKEIDEEVRKELKPNDEETE